MGPREGWVANDSRTLAQETCFIPAPVLFPLPRSQSGRAARGLARRETCFTSCLELLQAYGLGERRPALTQGVMPYWLLRRADKRLTVGRRGVWSPPFRGALVPQGVPGTPMLVLRDVQKSDLAGLKRLAAVLNTVNLPNNEETLAAIIDKSVKSFAGKVKNPLEREYLFVLEDTRNETIIGTSMIIAQHGTYEAPHIYYEVSEREHYSASLERHLRHKVLSIAYNYAGPTEVGGLVVDPPYRATADKPGKQLSYVRFLFIAMHRRLFRPRVLAELLPPLLPDGRSLLWEACGRKFTGLSYQDADRLSRQNKEFIKELFPSSDIYASLFPTRVQKVLGEVGPQTRGVQRMLERIGFKYMERIDPFDGGPHFEAEVADVTLVRRYRTVKLAAQDFEREGDDVLVAFERESGRSRFRSVRTQARVEDQILYLPRARQGGARRLRRSEAVPHSVRVRHGSGPPHDAAGPSQQLQPALSRLTRGALGIHQRQRQVRLRPHWIQ